MSWKSVLKALRFVIDLSTQALPSTFRRTVMPASRRFWSSMCFLLFVIASAAKQSRVSPRRDFWIASLRSQ
jgi:hypothetical protein